MIETRDLLAADLDEAIGVVARGMRDNPLHVAAYGLDPGRRLKCHARLTRAFFEVFTDQQPICAVREGRIVGLTGAAPPGNCQPTAVQRLKLVPALLVLGPRTAARVGSWMNTWAKHDPAEPHVHLGPLAVDAPLQGHGIGTEIMREHCRRLDDSGVVGYLETDKPDNVRFYERFGYEVMGEGAVIGVRNWFMRRQPASPN
jgi:ribosomal protein S18 acetylase RimI-like enzyme